MQTIAPEDDSDDEEGDEDEDEEDDDDEAENEDDEQESDDDSNKEDEELMENGDINEDLRLAVEKALGAAAIKDDEEVNVVVLL